MTDWTPLPQECVNDLITYCREEAPIRIPNLYEGLESREISEVITDTLAYLYESYTSSGGQNENQSENRTVVRWVEVVKSQLGYLLQILPLAVEEAWERRQREVDYEKRFITGWLYPEFVELHEDVSEIPGAPTKQEWEGGGLGDYTTTD